MTEAAQIATTSETPPAKPPRKPRAARRKAAPPPDNPFAGLTPAECCTACWENPGHCVLTKDDASPAIRRACGHPYKSSHPTASPKTNARIEAATRHLKKQKIG